MGIRESHKYYREQLSELTLTKLAKDARFGGQWVKIKDDYLTPEELELKAKYLCVYYPEVKVVDPKAVVCNGRKKLTDLQLKQIEFERKVSDYFNGE